MAVGKYLLTDFSDHLEGPDASGYSTIAMSVARVSHPALLQALVNKQKIPSLHKHSNGSWNEAGLGVNSGALVRNIMHAATACVGKFCNHCGRSQIVYEPASQFAISIAYSPSNKTPETLSFALRFKGDSDARENNSAVDD